MEWEKERERESEGRINKKNGMYIYQMKVDGKLIGVGKFVKK